MNGKDKSPYVAVSAGGGHGEAGAAERQQGDTRRKDKTRVAHRILVVEDQEDVRRLLVTALEIEGYHVDEASNALDGLKWLQHARYNLVLSDYAMPGGTGTWMLHEATHEGLLDGTVALIVTAHPEVGELSDVEVVQKPLDLDRFLEQVRKVLREGHREPGDGEISDDGRRRPVGMHHRVELVLYISSASPASIQARRNLERILSDFEAAQIKLSICDLVRDPMAGDGDGVAFTPTLVKRSPEPRMWVLGNLREQEIVSDLLRVCGVDAKT
jgi:two-component system response regulator GlrR